MMLHLSRPTQGRCWCYCWKYQSRRMQFVRRKAARVEAAAWAVKAVGGAQFRPRRPPYSLDILLDEERDRSTAPSEEEVGEVNQHTTAFDRHAEDTKFATGHTRSQRMWAYQ